MRKFFALISITVLAALMASSCAFADAKLPIVQYQCMVCDKYFYGFDGDPLDSEELNDPDIQLKRVFQLGDRGKNLEPCSGGFKAHVFERVGTFEATMSEIAKHMSRIAVLKDGKNLNNMTISDWVCMAPDCRKGEMYTLNDENLMITDWEQQLDKIVSLKGGHKIPKCNSRYLWGHAFWRSAGLDHAPVKSYDIAQLAYDIYYVK